MTGLGHLHPRRSERGALIGATGCGKTTLAKELMKPYPAVVAIDPKCSLGASESHPEGHLRGFYLCRSPEALAQAADRYDRLQYRPDPGYQNAEDYDRVYWWCFQRRNHLLYTDEVKLVQHGRDITDGMRACVTSGRERNIGMLHGMQRPRGIDNRLLTESEHFFVFRLRNAEDRRYVADLAEAEEIHLQPVSGHWFYHSGPRTPVGRHILQGVK